MFIDKSVPTATEALQPEQRHPLPSYQDYTTNSSVRAYQTAYFSSRCSQDTDAPTGQVQQLLHVSPGDVIKLTDTNV